MDLQLNGKRALITGSTLGIGFAMIHYGVTKTAQVALARGIAETTI